MSDIFMHNISRIYQSVPTSVYVFLLIVLCLGTLILISIKGYIEWRFVSGLLLTEYVFFIFCSTVFFRKTTETGGLVITPFWSYTAIQAGRDDLMRENIMNVLAFIPIGVLLWCTFRDCKLWMALLVGMGLSLSVEVFQYVFKRGLTEFDDVFHNTLGCLIGFMIVSLIKGGMVTRKLET